jgi:DNA repair protein RadC
LPARLSQPARRALATVGVKRLEQLSKFNETEIKKLHGMGPSGLAQLRSALEAKGLSFADKKQ